jgi:hypothetical protein
MVQQPVFFDASGRRAVRIRIIAWVVGLAALMILTGFAASLIWSPPLSGLDLPGRARATALVSDARKPGLLARAERLAAAARKRRLDQIAARPRLPSAQAARVLPAILKPQKDRSLAIGFYTNWAGKDDASWPSLKRSLKHLDWVVPSWWRLMVPIWNSRSRWIVALWISSAPPSRASRSCR